MNSYLGSGYLGAYGLTSLPGSVALAGVGTIEAVGALVATGDAVVALTGVGTIEGVGDLVATGDVVAPPVPAPEAVSGGPWWRVRPSRLRLVSLPGTAYLVGVGTVDDAGALVAHGAASVALASVATIESVGVLGARGAAVVALTGVGIIEAVGVAVSARARAEDEYLLGLGLDPEEELLFAAA